jgi:2-oxoisovalerate dehydrogenase E1 component
LTDYDLYRKMLLSRTLELELIKLFKEGKGFDLHPNIGQEAISVGVCNVLGPQDYSVCTHRSVTHAIARDVPLKPLVCELLGRKNGLVKGIAGEMHLSYPEKRFMFAFQQVGTHTPVAAGIAWASKYVKKEKDVITACFIGDASTGNGQFYEGMQLACLKELPLLIIVENNGLAGNITPNYYQPTESVRDRVEGYPMGRSFCQGWNIDEVITEAQRARNWIIENQRPYLLECYCFRGSKHKLAQGDMRSQKEIDEGMEKYDPLTYFEQKLRMNGLLAASIIHAEVAKEIKDALDYALKSELSDLPQIV